MKPHTVFKSSFAPISHPDTRILVLGSLPGERSLQLGEYYGHPQNRFWRVIAVITGNSHPKNYVEKLTLLQASRIGLWDVAHTAMREGSLDSAIRQALPNDLDGFVSNHPHLNTIGFNGKKAEALFNRFFVRSPHIRYISLASTSPANARTSLEQLCELWKSLGAV